MYYKKHDNSLLVRQSLSSPQASVPLGDFAFVSAVSFSAEDEALSLTGILNGQKLPSLKNRYRGDLRLYRWKLGNKKWARVYNGYSHDPVAIPGTKNVAFYYGNGLAIIDENGNLIQKWKLGNFNWGAPSLSSSPGGNWVAMVKWRGDDQKLFVYDVNKQVGNIYKPSCYRYCWYDEGYILYHLASSLKLLHLATGRSTVFLDDVRKLSLDMFERELIDFRDLDESIAKVKNNFGAIKTKGDRIFFTLTIIGSRQKPYDVRYEGLFSIDKAKTQLKLEHLCKSDELIATFDVDNSDEGSVLWLECYKGNTIVARKRVVTGGNKSLLNEGWDIMPSGLFPEFGFHWIES